MDNKEIVQNDIADAQDKVQKPQQDLKDEIKNLNKDIVKFTKLKNEKESELDNLLNLQISLQNEYAKLVNIKEKISNEGEESQKEELERNKKSLERVEKSLHETELQWNDNHRKLIQAKKDLNNVEEEVSNIEKKQVNAKDSSEIIKRDVERADRKVKISYEDWMRKKKEIESTEKDIAQCKNDISSKKKQLEKEKDKLPTTDELVKEVQKKIDKNLESIDTVQKQKDELQSILSKLVSTIEKEKNKIDLLPQIRIPKDYTQVLFENFDYGKISREEVADIISPGLELNNKKLNFSEIDDKNKISDVTKLTLQELIEISTFVASLLNPLREKIGSRLIEVTPDSIQFTQAVVDRYNQDNWQTFYSQKSNKLGLGHDIEGLSDLWNQTPSVFEDYDSKDEELANGEEYFNEFSDNEMTMADLKTVIYRVLVDFLFNDTKNNFGHLETLLGLNKSKDYSTHYMAVGIDNNLAIHFEFAYNNIKANGSYVISDFGKKNIEAKINELKAEQAGNLIKLSDLNNQLENENKNKMVLKEELQNAKKGPDMTEITKLEDDINSLNKNISVLKDRLRGKNNLSELVREEWIKNKGLLRREENKLEASKAAITATEIELNSIKVDLSQKEKQVEKYNKSELENSEQLNILKVNYETIQENMQAILDDLKEYNGIDQKIEELKEKLINNEKDVAKITVVYNDLVVKVQSYQNVLEYKEKELSDLQDNE
ncbi:SEC10/PgrA surface exclusion domain-containing protein [Ligilactobacillus salivarius]|uniref:SEC10/PgrA surface exclusion domain-containing protein n=1 Tax=Ligilactobacillus salivarius TaxID=1624 RepID=UPI0025A356D2|nr:SEC10/PgrA surface exclusion domain-containing protein [Ligilactobacillus salivarius]MDM8262493.1 SEC10/PgrA surface exclusion domain-containing protein [Ligilactobacillus salivarius]